MAWHTSVSFAASDWAHPWEELTRHERPRVLRLARQYLREAPKTITSAPAPRSAGGLHDFYSEGDYWWPAPANPNGPYIRRDGESNPDNFVAHRELLMLLSIQVPALVAAWLLTKDRAYSEHAIAHLRAWFITSSTRMNPNLEYAQAIHGIDTGRSIGIIDTVHLVEVAQSALILQRAGGISIPDRDGVHAWFSEYLEWLTKSDRGVQERNQKNNHGSCWLLQAAEFATYTDNTLVRDDCRSRFKNILVPEQIASNGSFPLELARTKPYGYSLFDLDILGMCAQVLSDRKDDLWTYRLADGRGLNFAFRFMFPFIEDKSKWPYRHDIEYFNNLPVRQPSLLFAGLAYRCPQYLDLWQRLEPDPTVPEVIRNHPIRQPLIWLSQ
jgi:hypothetical protein